MKKVIFVIIFAAFVVEMCILLGVFDDRPCEHNWERQTSERIAGTCLVKGIDTYKCSKCGEKKTEEDSYFGQHKVDYKTVKEPTTKAEGMKKGICSVCNQEITSEIPRIGSTYVNPIVMSSSELYSSVKKGGAKQYVGSYIQVKGKIKSVKRYSDLNGYYLEGTTGKGVVCWSDYYFDNFKVGSTVTFTGKVEVDSGKEHIELTGCIPEFK